MALSDSQQIYEALKNSQSALITFKKEHDGDAVSAGLALSLLLKKLDKSHDLVCHDFVMPKQFNFLPGADQVKPHIPNLRKFIISLNTGKVQAPKVDFNQLENELQIIIEPEKGTFLPHDISMSNTKYRHDLIITLSTPDLDALHTVYDDHTDFFFNTPILNIDHSPENENYGHYNLVNVTATSVSELVYDLIEKIDLSLIDEKIATCLLTGMIVKTKSFKTQRVTPKSLSIASQLMAIGADRELIIRNLYQTRSVNTLKLWGRTLQKIQTNPANQLAWSFITLNDFQDTQTQPDDITDIIDEMITNIPSIELTCLFYEKSDGQHCLIKSEGKHNLPDLLTEYKPVGKHDQVHIHLKESAPNDLLQHLGQILTPVFTK